MTIETRPAALTDLSYVDSLQRANANALAFYPRSTLDREVQAQRIVLASISGEPCGYLWHGAFAVEAPIHQACIQYDARGYLYGAALVRHVLALLWGAHVMAVTLRCGSDVAANGFWRTMGFQCVAVTDGGARRMRKINCWRYDLHQPLFTLPSVEPSNQPASAAAWNKTGGGTGNRFHRGKKIDAFRQVVQRTADQT